MFPKKNVPRWVIILIDLCISATSLLLAYLIRFDIKADADLWEKEWHILSKSLVVFFTVRLLVFYFFGIHRGLVRHTSTSDFRRLFLAVSLSSFIFAVIGLIRFKFFDGYYLFPISVLVIEYVFCMFLVTVARFTIKLWYLETQKPRDVQKRVLIYGAGISGLIAKRTIEKDALLPMEVIGFVDDNKNLKGARIEGINVIHPDRLKEVIKNEGVDQVILAIQEPDPDNQKRVVDICFENNVELKKVPSPKSWINGEFSAKQLASVNIEDLLGRKPIVLNQDALEDALKNKVILVTGAAGSIGSGLVQQIANYAPLKIVLFDQAESPMYELELELRSEFPNQDFEVVIGDIRNRERLKRVFETFNPSWVYHAAAYKHVPLMEENPSEAISTNVRGTKNLVDLALEYGIKKFIMISTDKAVNPTNVMGASKRIAEMLAQKANTEGDTQFITTRFGNVLGSNGSVIPLFKKQIAQGGPITVTDERITRFFMTIPEACQLVLEAGVMGSGGEIFVFDMGESVRIVDLAKNMIRLSGLTLGKDIEIVFTGLRPGEKLYEELLSDKESTLPTHHPKILIAKDRGVDESNYLTIERLVDAVSSSNNMELVEQMKLLVPEFISNNSEFSRLDRKK